MKDLHGSYSSVFIIDFEKVFAEFFAGFFYCHSFFIVIHYHSEDKKVFRVKNKKTFLSFPNQHTLDQQRAWKLLSAWKLD